MKMKQIGILMACILFLGACSSLPPKPVMEVTMTPSFIPTLKATVTAVATSAPVATVTPASIADDRRTNYIRDIYFPDVMCAVPKVGVQGGNGAIPYILMNDHLVNVILLPDGAFDYFVDSSVMMEDLPEVNWEENPSYEGNRISTPPWQIEAWIPSGVHITYGYDEEVVVPMWGDERKIVPYEAHLFFIFHCSGPDPSISQSNL